MNGLTTIVRIKGGGGATVAQWTPVKGQIQRLSVQIRFTSKDKKRLTKEDIYLIMIKVPDGCFKKFQLRIYGILWHK